VALLALLYGILTVWPLAVVLVFAATLSGEAAGLLEVSSSLGFRRVVDRGQHGVELIVFCPVGSRERNKFCFLSPFCG
jgi:hypothetical protein